jgi:hypothetical protein
VSLNTSHHASLRVICVNNRDQTFYKDRGFIVDAGIEYKQGLGGHDRRLHGERMY